MNDAVSLYDCSVTHRRNRPVGYFFKYRIFSVLIDIDRLNEANQVSRLFSVGRFNLFSFKPSDHLPDSHDNLRQWIDQVLQENGIQDKAHKVRILCMPGVFGWVFNPLSVWYCSQRNGKPLAVLCEVHNTFGERHCYLLKANPLDEWPLQNNAEKIFHVSPFLQVAGEYRFHLKQPAERVSIAIDYLDAEGRVLTATQTGKQQVFNSANLLKFLFTIPLQTFKVLAAIHWHAARLWLQRVPFIPKPQPPKKEVS